MKVISHHDESEKFRFVLLLSSCDGGADQPACDAFSVIDSELGLMRTTHGIVAFYDIGETFISAPIEFFAQPSGIAVVGIEGASEKRM